MREFLHRQMPRSPDAAHPAAQGRAPRWRVHLGSRVFCVQRLWHDGFALGADDAHALRGFADIYDGSRHVAHCLIIATEARSNEVICEYKRYTPAQAGPPADFWRDEHRPAPLLPPGF